MCDSNMHGERIKIVSSFIVTATEMLPLHSEIICKPLALSLK
jgi:hypothetical protein